MANASFADEFDVPGAERMIVAGEIDLVSFGRRFLANPDLPERLRQGAALNTPDADTFYQGGAKGYTDYPALTSWRPTPAVTIRKPEIRTAGSRSDLAGARRRRTPSAGHVVPGLRDGLARDPAVAERARRHAHDAHAVGVDAADRVADGVLADRDVLNGMRHARETRSAT